MKIAVDKDTFLTQLQTVTRVASTRSAIQALSGVQIAPKFLDFYPAVVWEDQDECLEVRPEDIPW